MKYQYIEDNEREDEVSELCDALGVSRSGYYSWKSRIPCSRNLEDKMIKEKISQISQKAVRYYGHRPIYHHLKEQSLSCGRDRTLRLINELGLLCSQKKRFKALGTNSNHSFGYSANVLAQLGNPTGINQVWVADTTYLLTDNGWQYLATVMDLFSRKIIGWSVSANNDNELVCQALTAAIINRRQLGQRIVHHSDRGSTYASDKYQRLLRAFAMKPSMSAKGNSYDNAAMESFYGSYKSSCVGDYIFEDENEVKANIFDYI